MLGERGLLEKRRLDEEAQPGGDGGGEEEEASEGGRETHRRQQAVAEEKDGVHEREQVAAQHQQEAEIEGDDILELVENLADRLVPVRRHHEPAQVLPDLLTAGSHVSSDGSCGNDIL